MRAVEVEARCLPSIYYLNESNPDMLAMHRQDGSFVAAFSAPSTTREGMVQAAEEDYRKLIRTLAARLLGDDVEEHRSA